MGAENVPLNDLASVVEDVSLAVGEVETSFSRPALEVPVGAIVNQETQTDVSLRELLAIDEALQRYRGELVNNLGKLTELDVTIDRIEEEIDYQDTPDETRERLEELLVDLNLERTARIEATSVNERALRSQFNRIKETIARVLEKDQTLGERIRTLFREQGVTIATLLTAIGLVISTIVGFVTGSSGSPVMPKPTPEVPVNPTPATPTVKGRIKTMLDNLASALTGLGSKALAALPGIIGGILSWVFNLLSKTASWLGNNVWALFVFVGTLFMLELRK